VRRPASSLGNGLKPGSAPTLQCYSTTCPSKHASTWSGPPGNVARRAQRCLAQQARGGPKSGSRARFGWSQLEPS
jgi:hypothetical protein